MAGECLAQPTPEVGVGRARPWAMPGTKAQGSIYARHPLPRPQILGGSNPREAQVGKTPETRCEPCSHNDITQEAMMSAVLMSTRI